MKAILKIQDEIYYLNQCKSYKISSKNDSDIYLDKEIVFLIQVNEYEVKIGDEIYKNGVFNFDDFSLFVLEYENQYLFDNEYFLVGKEEDTVIGNLNIYLDKKRINSKNPYYINMSRCNGENLYYEYDKLFFENGVLIIVFDSKITIYSIEAPVTDRIKLERFIKNYRFDDYHRSPRIVLRQPDDRISIVPPHSDENRNKQSLIKMIIMPLAMIVFTVATYFMNAGGGMILMMIGMSTITIAMSVHTYFGDRKIEKSEKEEKLQIYLDYLDEKYQQIYQLYVEQENALKFHYPEIKEICEMAKHTNRRIYEKTTNHFDFLTFSIGNGEVNPSFKIEYQENELTKYSSEIRNKINELVEYYKTLKDVPLNISLMNGPIGYIGSREVVIEQLQQMIIQISIFHSYHDITFIPIFREEEYQKWNWSRWIPHMQFKETNLRSFVYTQQSRDQILTTLYQLVKERKMSDSESKEIKYSPHYIFLITDISLLLDHNIMEYINEDLTKYGISYVFTSDVIESLPEHVNTVIDFKGDKKGKLLLENGNFMDKEFLPFVILENSVKEEFARNLSRITHIQTLRNAIPEKITFLEMYETKNIEDLNILNRWTMNKSYQSLSVPVGFRGRNEILNLDLHEKAHGPHGLVAGTTGSGKSEFVQSYILSLAVNFHPYEVAFLLVDYKGGGMANLFKDLPHLLGTITNLDGNQVNRALDSIKAELERRQRIFGQANVNNINEYSKLFEQNKVSEPLPHLFIISDEFAELKKEQPEFIEKLVSAARIGRSLGIHLILATQKPSGVVDDQIWSNSRFKVALKVQDASDSKEMIKTGDAAEITLPGRAYLQVGNNEVYELFQSAYSGGNYYKDTDRQNYKNHTIYEIKSNGQLYPINKDLSGLDHQSKITKVPSELDEIVLSTKSIFEKSLLEKVKRPWLPPLNEQIYLEDFRDIDFKTMWFRNKQELEVLVGYQDLPTKQDQLPLIFNMEERGHILLTASPGFGKSTFLQTFSIDLMRNYTPDFVNFYLYDFGNSGLISLVDYPHVADYFGIEEEEKIIKSMNFLYKEVQRRKELLKENRLLNLKQYNEKFEKIPNLFILIDGYDSISDFDKVSDKFNETLNLIARDGNALGIYLIVTTTRINSLRIQLQTNFKTKLSLYLFDNSDLSSIVGRTNIKLDEIKGRGVIKEEDVVHFQVLLPFKSENYYEYSQKIQSESRDMKKYWNGKLPLKIPMLPEIVNPNLFESETEFILGLYKEMVNTAKFVYNQSILLISDNSKTMKYIASIVRFNLNRLSSDTNVVIFDTKNMFENHSDNRINLFKNSIEIESVLKSAFTNIKERIEKNKIYRKWVIVINDLKIFNSFTKEEIEKFIIKAPEYGITPIFVVQHQDVSSSYDEVASLVRQQVNQIYVGMKINDQQIMNYGYISNLPSLKQDEGYIITEEDYQFVKLVTL